MISSFFVHLIFKLLDVNLEVFREFLVVLLFAENLLDVRCLRKCFGFKPTFFSNIVEFLLKIAIFFPKFFNFLREFKAKNRNKLIWKSRKTHF